MTGRLLALLALPALLMCAPPAGAVAEGELAPEFVGLDGWINSEPQTLEALRGRVVLVNFWTLGCGNCVATLPYVKAWHERFAAAGLVILGIHTPELEFERPRAKVEATVRGRAIEYPVALDLDSRTWKAYGNHAWPAFYFIDRRGVVRHVQLGEGQYERSERWLAELLAE